MTNDELERLRKEAEVELLSYGPIKGFEGWMPKEGAPLYSRFNLSEEQAQKIYDEYFEKFAELPAFEVVAVDKEKGSITFGYVDDEYANNPPL